MLAQAARRNASLQLHYTYVQRNFVRKGPSLQMVALRAQEGTRVKTAHPAQPRSRRRKKSVKMPRKRKTTTRKLERGDTPLTRKNKGPSPRMRTGKRGVLASATQKTLKTLRPNRTAKTIAISGKNRRRKEKVPFLLPVRKDERPTQVSSLELGTQTRLTRVQPEQGGKGSRGEFPQLSLKGIKNVIHDRKPKRREGKGKIKETNTGLQTNKGIMSILKRRGIDRPSKGRRTHLVNPLRVTRKVGNTIAPPTGPVLTRPRRDNRMARATIGETRNGKGPTTNEASQGTHIRVTKSVNGISRAEFRKMGKGKLMQALARLNRNVAGCRREER